MGSVIAQAMMSLDGSIAKDDNPIGRLFDWLQNGEVELVSPRGDMTLHPTSQSAEHIRSWIASVGVLELLVGRWSPTRFGPASRTRSSSST